MLDFILAFVYRGGRGEKIKSLSTKLCEKGDLKEDLDNDDRPNL